MEELRAFVVRPFGKKKDLAGNEIDFEAVHDKLIGPSLKEAGLVGGTAGVIVEPGNIREDVFALIIEADLVICDITIHNANVFYELGIRHALRKNRTVMIKGKPAADAPVFDLLTDRYQSYDLAEPEKAKNDLVKVIKAALSSIRDTDSPIFKMVPTLPEAEPANVAQVVPNDLIEEIERARHAEFKGWLRLLAADVTARRFQWPALRRIGQAQWEIEDWDAARSTFERVIGNDPYDVLANLALANLYERAYRRNPQQRDLLRRSDQAIGRVLSGRRSTKQQEAEALALRARNRKTEWRLDLKIDDLAERRKDAVNHRLREAYEQYREAYLRDLNHFWPGLAAWQMATIALDLSQDKETWVDMFETTEAAEAYARKLNQDIKELKAAVPLAVGAALGNLPPDHPDRVWAEMSPADICFLSDDRGPRVVRTYKDAVSKSNRFAWGAAKGQLELFASLGIRAELANDIIQQVEATLGAEKKKDVEQHVVVFAGHQLDEIGRVAPRFPAHCEGRARELIREKLEQLKGEGLTVLASVSPGSDILCHELCRELSIPSTICLPMPADVYTSEVFRDLDGWRSRYLELKRHLSTLQLSDRPGLPNWLRGDPPRDPWERGNEWVLEMAIASGAKVTLLVLWDGKDFSGKPGGTGHMVSIARQRQIYVRQIDAGSLLQVS